ncbi:EAL domain-containing protein [Insolitispirillum peregrinum]|uniref:Sensor protein FixL n=1 Tax=Insolitispirillum peregrinum TaxID=80876 RepID=A0A1N7Q6S4_9PROT|nr:EAL domain-containing protein [Insolitispirillum peregrinum]SIT18555.1 PAS domain S-box-containing protein/diguanylate cyclase (GGDEF) domain-containing protein [Insolitispirillum peregrinum]
MRRLLLIEPNPVYARLIDALVSRCGGAFVLEVRDSLSAAVQAPAVCDLILLSLMPPVDSLLALLPSLRAAYPDQPLITLGDDDDAEIRQRALQAGVFRCLPKGALSMDQLQDALQQALLCHRPPVSESLWLGVLNNLPAAAGVLRPVRDQDGLCHDFLWRWGNAACATVLGQRAEILVGRALSETLPVLLGPDSLVGLAALPGNDAQTAVSPFETEVCRAHDGGVQWLAVTANRLGDDITLVISDVSANKAQEQALLAARRHAEAADELKSRVLRALSHEMRQPLNTIVGFSDMIDNEVFGPLAHPHYKAYIKDICSASQHLSQLLENLLERSQLDEMAKSDSGYRQMFDLAPDMMCVLRDGVVVMMNAAGAALLETSAEACVGKPLELFVAPESLPLVHGGLAELANSQGRIPLKLCTADQRLIDVEMAATPFSHQDVGQNGVIVVARDVTQRQTATRAILQREERLRKIMETMVDALIIIDQKGLIETFNPAAERIFGYQASDVIGQNVSLLMPRSQGVVHDGYIHGYMQSRHSRVIGIGREIEGQRKDGTVFPVELALSEMHVGDQCYFIGVLRDIAERKQAEERLRFLATRDHLTGLPNRAMFRDSLEQAVVQAEKSGEMVGVLFVDLDHFKNINDTLGHQIGDRVLQAVAQRLGDSLRPHDMVFHLSGDEFTLILHGLDSPEDAARMSQEVLDRLALPFDIDGREIYTSGSIGIVIYPENAESIGNLLKNVDTAVHHAKRQGRNTYSFYSENLSQTMIRRLQVENGLRRALERRELAVVYQPKIDLASGECTGAEALLRWNSEELGFVSPAEFIPVAEETGLIVAIGDWVLLHVCQQIRAWVEQGRPAMRIAVNLSARQFREPNLAQRIVEILHLTGISSGLLELELTESMLVENAEEAIAALRSLKTLGVTLSIDDFGTGYSSLSYLKRFPIDALKIDQSFVRDIPESSDDMSITKAIISMGRSLELKLVAEGTETLEQIEFLQANGCHIAQGYYFSKPVLPHLFEAFLDQRQSLARLTGS